MKQRQRDTSKKQNMSFPAVNLILLLSSFICHICLLISCISSSCLCPQTPFSVSKCPSTSHLQTPLSASVSPSLSSLHGALSLRLPSSLLQSSAPSLLLFPPPPHRTLDSLPFPPALTLMQHPVLTTFTFKLISSRLPLRSSNRLLLHHLLTHIIPRFSLCVVSPASTSSYFSLPTHSTLPSWTNTRVHIPMLTGTQGQSTLFSKPATGQFCLITRLLDTEHSWGRG